MSYGYGSYQGPEIGCVWGWDNVSGFGRLEGGSTSASLWPTANKAFYYPINFKTPVAVNRLNVFIGTTASAHIDAGLYDFNGNKLVTAGSTNIAGSSTVQTFTLTTTLIPRGMNYFAIAVDTTATFRLNGFTSLTGTQLVTQGIREQASAFPLPASITLTTQTSFNFIPQFSVLAASLP